MKKIILAILIFSFFISAKSQTNNTVNFANGFSNYLFRELNKSNYEELDRDNFAKKHNLAQFFSEIDATKTLGIIGNEMDRIKIKIFSVEKANNSNTKFKITGKANHFNNILSFSGDIDLQAVFSFQEKITRHGLVVCEFTAEFKEKGSAGKTGIFKGSYYLILSKVADDIRYPKTTPQFLQNYTFAGNWYSTDKRHNYPVVWGDGYSLIDLQEFYYDITDNPRVDEDIIEEKWKSYYDAYTEGVKSKYKNKALKEERQKWWK